MGTDMPTEDTRCDGTLGEAIGMELGTVVRCPKPAEIPLMVGNRIGKYCRGHAERLVPSENQRRVWLARIVQWARDGIRPPWETEDQ